jgi:hypothetical protein
MTFVQCRSLGKPQPNTAAVDINVLQSYPNAVWRVSKISVGDARATDLDLTLHDVMKKMKELASADRPNQML